MSSPLILFVSSDAESIAALQRAAQCLPARLRVADSPPEATKALQRGHFEAVLVQVDGGHTAEPRYHPALSASSPVVAVARKGSIAQAVRAVQAGATDYLSVSTADPQTLAERLRAVMLAGRRGPVAHEWALGRPVLFPEFITLDERTLSACRIAWHFADTGVVIWLKGETGTGKSLLARQVHLASGRHFARFLELNCGVLTRVQLLRELFGNSEAPRRGPPGGSLRRAAGGSLLLAEPTRLDPELHDALLGALGGGERSGAGDAPAPEVRLMLASTQWKDAECDPLLAAISSRMDVMSVQLPPLRERIADVPVLARHFMRLCSARHGCQTERISRAALSAIMRYGWPGNVRELEAAIEFAVVLARQGTIEPEHLPGVVRAAETAAGPRGNGSPLPLKQALRESERLHIIRALRTANWNKRRAARRLHISRSTLYKKLREHAQWNSATIVGGGPDFP